MVDDQINDTRPDEICTSTTAQETTHAEPNKTSTVNTNTVTTPANCEAPWFLNFLDLFTLPFCGRPDAVVGGQPSTRASPQQMQIQVLIQENKGLKFELSKLISTAQTAHRELQKVKAEKADISTRNISLEAELNKAKQDVIHYTGKYRVLKERQGKEQQEHNVRRDQNTEFVLKGSVAGEIAAGEEQLAGMLLRFRTNTFQQLTQRVVDTTSDQVNLSTEEVKRALSAILFVECKQLIDDKLTRIKALDPTTTTTDNTSPYLFSKFVVEQLLKLSVDNDSKDQESHVCLLCKVLGIDKTLTDSFSTFLQQSGCTEFIADERLQAQFLKSVNAAVKLLLLQEKTKGKIWMAQADEPFDPNLHEVISGECGTAVTSAACSTSAGIFPGYSNAEGLVLIKAMVTITSQEVQQL